MTKIKLNSSLCEHPFGMIMPGRNFNADRYRYGFNGQEKDDEIIGSGNLYTAQFWSYDPRLIRRWNLDPKSTIGLSDYSCFGGNPILFTDPFGETWKDKKDKEIADNTKKDIATKVDKIDKDLVKLENELSNDKPTEDRTTKIKEEIGLLKEDKNALNNVVEGLDKMEQDMDYAYSFSAHDADVGTHDGYTKSLTGEAFPGLTTYKVIDGTNYQGQKYSAIITLNYNKWKSTGDLISDGSNSNSTKAVRAHEIIHGFQVATRQLLIPENPKDRNGENFESAIKGFDAETPGYKTQDAYEKY